MNAANDNCPRWPRGLSRVQAATYVGVSHSIWDKLVTAGEMPAPKRVCGRTIWDKVAVDLAFDVWGGGNASSEKAESILEFAA